MKMTEIVCTNCGITVPKPLKEITRQRKKGNFNFYCNSKCHGDIRLKLIREEYRTCVRCETIFLIDFLLETQHCSEICSNADNVKVYRGYNKNYISGTKPKIPNSVTIVSNMQKQREQWKYEALGNYLVKNNVDHEFEYPFGRFIFDLALFWNRFFIEFDGPDHKDSRQMILDREKEHCANFHGWKVYRIPVPPSTVIPSEVILPYI